MQLHAINVGYGDAFLFTEDASPPSAPLLIDTGSGQQEEFQNDSCRTPVTAYLQEQSIRALEHCILTHLHEDHVGALPALLSCCHIHNLYLPFPPQDLFSLHLPFDNLHQLPLANNTRLFLKSLTAFWEACALLRHNKTAVWEWKAGESRKLGRLQITAVAPSPSIIPIFLALLTQLSVETNPETQIALLQKLDSLSNATALALKIEAGSFCALFASDSLPQNWVVPENDFSILKNVTVFKIPHHAQIDAVQSPLLAHMPLTATITTASSDRRYNSAHPNVYQTLNRYAQTASRPLQHLFTDPPAAFPYAANPPGKAVRYTIPLPEGGDEHA